MFQDRERPCRGQGGRGSLGGPTPSACGVGDRRAYGLTLSGGQTKKGPYAWSLPVNLTVDLQEGSPVGCAVVGSHTLALWGKGSAGSRDGEKSPPRATLEAGAQGRFCLSPPGRVAMQGAAGTQTRGRTPAMFGRQEKGRQRVWGRQRFPARTTWGCALRVTERGAQDASCFRSQTPQSGHEVLQKPSTPVPEPRLPD